MLVEVDVTGDVAALLPVDRHPDDLLLGAEVQPCPGCVLDQLEARELEIADVRIPRRLGRRHVRRVGVRRGLGDDRAVGELDVGDGLRRVEQVDPLVGREVRVHRRAVEAILARVVDPLRQRQAGIVEVGDHRGRARDRVVHAQRAAAVRLDDPPVRQLVEADRLLQVRRRADLRLLIVREHGRAAVAVGRVARAGSPRDRALQMRRECRVEGLGRVAERGVERPAAPVVLAEGDGMAAAHRAAVDPVEHGALGLRAERILDDRRQDVRQAGDVRLEVVPMVRAVPVERERLARVMDTVEDLHRARLQRGPSRSAGTENVAQEVPRRVGLDRRADADEATALTEVGLEDRALGVRQRARDARVQEHDRAIGREVRRCEFGSHRGRRGRRDGERVAS